MPVKPLNDLALLPPRPTPPCGEQNIGEQGYGTLYMFGDTTQNMKLTALTVDHASTPLRAGITGQERFGHDITSTSCKSGEQTDPAASMRAHEYSPFCDVMSAVTLHAAPREQLIALPGR